MHETIPADRWCVTWADLKYLRKSVKSAIRKEVIQPPADGRDDFLMVDEVYGPSIYTVNEQYIKPITHFHGKMSWALMRNPAGLDCDMFISHAWLEGIFEFLRKVLHSWPRGVRTAWCCMLANPQNLNIEAFLQSPSKSPFALALRASEVVLVVPNRHVSVYTRLWCAYEAYIADQEGKTILIAKTSNLQGIIFAMLPMAVAALIGAMLGSYARHHWQHCARQVTYVGGVASVAAYNVQHNQCRMLLNLFCEMICFEKIVHWEPAFQWAKEWGFPWQVHCGAYVAFFFTAAILFCVLEVDRVNAERTALEAEQLRKGYRGSIHYADCTQPEDAQRIRHEIGCKSDVVDYAIDVLLSAGMSTPALRDIAREGVDIQRTAYSGVASSVVLLFPVDFITFTFAVVETIYLRGNFLRMLLSSICILERLILATLIYRRSIDERCFILKVMDKIVAALLISFVGLCLMPTVTMRKVSKIWIIGSNIGFALMIAFAVLGIRGTAKLPMGLCWLQFFFARGLTSCAACCCCKSCEAEPSYDPEHQSLRNCSDSESGSSKETD